MKFSNGIDLNGQRIQNVASASAATDAVNKQDLDNAIRGLAWKQEVRAASTANLSLAAPGATIDGVTMVSGDRVLLKNQTAPAENGIYVWNGAAVAATRALDADTWTELAGSTVTVTEGTVNADLVFLCTANEGGTLGTTAVTWAQVGAGGTTYTGGTGISIGGSVISIDLNVVTRKYAASVGGSTSIAVTHGLGTKDVQVSTRLVSTDVAEIVDWTATDVNTVTLSFASAPGAGTYRVVVQG